MGYRISAGIHSHQAPLLRDMGRIRNATLIEEGVQDPRTYLNLLELLLEDDPFTTLRWVNISKEGV